MQCPVISFYIHAGMALFVTASWPLGPAKFWLTRLRVTAMVGLDLAATKRCTA